MLHTERVDMGRVEAFGYDSQPSGPWDMICCQVHDPLTFFSVLVSIVIGGLALGFGIAGFSQAHSNSDKIAVLEAAPPPPPPPTGLGLGTDCCFNQMKASAASYALSPLSSNSEGCYSQGSTGLIQTLSSTSSYYKMGCHPTGILSGYGTSYANQYGTITSQYTSLVTPIATGQTAKSFDGFGVALDAALTKVLVYAETVSAMKNLKGTNPYFKGYEDPIAASNVAKKNAETYTAPIPNSNPNLGSRSTWSGTIAFQTLAPTEGGTAGTYTYALPQGGAQTYQVPLTITHQCMSDGRVLATHALQFSRATADDATYPELTTYSALKDLYHTRYLNAMCP